MENKRQYSLKTLVPNLIILVAAPLALYFILHCLNFGDTLALAVAGCIPVIRTLTQFIVKKKLNIIGIISVSGFMLACLMTAVFGGGTLILKLYRPIITAAVGIIALLSAAVKKPIVALLLHRISGAGPDYFKDEKRIYRAQISTVAFGFFFVADALLHIFVALTLPTVTYMVASRVITIGLIALLFVVMRFIRARVAAD